MSNRLEDIMMKYKNAMALNHKNFEYARKKFVDRNKQKQNVDNDEISAAQIMSISPPTTADIEAKWQSSITERLKRLKFKSVKKSVKKSIKKTQKRI